jgi:hypothetical protein
MRPCNLQRVLFTASRVATTHRARTTSFDHSVDLIIGKCAATFLRYIHTKNGVERPGEMGTTLRAIRHLKHSDACSCNGRPQLAFHLRFQWLESIISGPPSTVNGASLSYYRSQGPEDTTNGADGKIEEEQDGKDITQRTGD